jgi:hypothetical protein
MKIINIEQKSPEWFAYRKGKIGGTRFGKVISGKKNRLIYTLADEILSDVIIEDEFQDEEMRFGTETEPIMCDLYQEQSGIKFKEVGLIQSDHTLISVASPDRLSECETIVLEGKCTMNGAIHMQRFFEGPESSYLPQIKNYFVQSNQIKEVHWVSYCPFRPEKPLVIHVFKREQFELEIPGWIGKLQEIQKQVTNIIDEFTF